MTVGGQVMNYSGHHEFLLFILSCVFLLFISTALILFEHTYRPCYRISTIHMLSY